MFRLKKVLGALCLGVVLSLGMSFVVFADGELMSEPFGDCGAKPTLADPAKYYVAILSSKLNLFTYTGSPPTCVADIA